MERFFMDDSLLSNSEEKLREVTVGELKPHNDQIILVDYDPNWPKLFEREAERIHSALGEKVLQLEHVGSTSIPGLCAKPIIDIILAVEDSSDESAYVPMLEKAGYTLRIREPDWFEHRVFKGADPEVNLHVFSKNVSEVDRMIRFRDWLRNNDSDRDKYAKEKRRLAQRKWKYVQDYADAKNAVIQEIMEKGYASDEDRN